MADCRRLKQISGVDDLQLCEVRRDACVYCRKTATSGPMDLNAILASMLHAIARKVGDRGGVVGCSVQQAAELREQAEWFLDEDPTEVDQVDQPIRSMGHCHHLGSAIGSRIDRIDGRIARLVVSRCHHPAHPETTEPECARCLDWTDRPGSDRDSNGWGLPIPPVRSGPTVRTWSVGVTTSPRRRPTLEWTLDGLIRAGWEQPRLFVDGPATIPSKHGNCPVTQREPKVGAWPNFYLSLAELVMRDPEADAYLMLQDDVAFFDGIRLRDYLESILWPGDRPGPVSLYTCQLDTQPTFGWTRHEAPWFLGAQALVFPAESARAFLMDPEVMAHRRSTVYNGLANVDTRVGSWAFHHGTPISFPTPSLCRHIGHASTLWAGAQIEGNRKQGLFAGEIEPVRRPPGSFDEAAFPCVGDLATYRSTVHRGIERMRKRSVEIRGSCRNLLRLLPEFVARIERLGAMFGSYRVVIRDDHSTDGTTVFLRDWSEANRSIQWVSDLVAEDVENRLGDHVIFVDPNLEGGWSFEGVAHSFGLDEWDFIGSNDLLLRPLVKSEPIFFDQASDQAADQNGPIETDFARLSLRRGEPARKVWSCFGGLGIYRTPSLIRADRTGQFQHHTIHQRMREVGFGRILLNPSQITIWNRWD